MIILEGPDGAGKTTLLKNLLVTFPDIPERPRFVPHEGPGDMGDLYQAVYNDFEQNVVTRNLAFYDRHPLWSEYVYGSVMPDREVFPSFTSPAARSMAKYLASSSLVILCLPPLATIKQNLGQDIVQMDGVPENIFRIYQQYQVLRSLWPGRVVTYDYTRDFDHMLIVSEVRHHIRQYRSESNV